MRKLRGTLTVLALAAGLALPTARPAGAQLLSAAFGGAVGVGAGGYITLAYVVGRAQTGHYLHDVKEFFGLKSVPVLIGGATGMALGYWSPDRLKNTVIYGSAGTVVGLGAGILIGPVIWEGPEGRWAGGAVGAGLGMAAGALAGMLRAPEEDGSGEPAVAARTGAIPVAFRIRL